MQDVFTQVQDLRQPLSSIVGYTDFLLGESIGILGNLQRRFLDRIRTSAERMTAMLDNFSAAAGSVSILPESSVDDIDLLNLIDKAISSTRDQMMERNIALRMDLPKHIPAVCSSEASLQKLVEALLARASSSSPLAGEVTLLVRLEGENGAKDFVLIQVIDQGDGITPQAVPAGSSVNHDEEAAASRENLVFLRSLAESLGGRVWVDSSPIGGSIFSLLFPITVKSENNNNGAGRFE
jgi:signal transduction histidine kinase